MDLKLLKIYVISVLVKLGAILKMLLFDRFSKQKKKDLGQPNKKSYHRGVVVVL